MREHLQRGVYGAIGAYVVLRYATNYSVTETLFHAVVLAAVMAVISAIIDTVWPRKPIEPLPEGCTIQVRPIESGWDMLRSFWEERSPKERARWTDSKGYVRIQLLPPPGADRP